MMARTCCVSPAGRQHLQNRFRRRTFHQRKWQADVFKTSFRNLFPRFFRTTEFSQLQNLGQQQRDLIDQAQDVIARHFF
jgi:hypothetical protein